MKKQIILLCMATLFFGCDNSSITPTVLPTIDNMIGIWKATSYIKNGQAMSKSFYASDFIKINADKSYSLHDSLRNDTYNCYHFGTLNFTGKRIDFNPKYGNYMYHNITKITTNTFTIKDTIDNVPFECNYSRVISPTTYQVKNKSTLSLNISTYCYVNNITQFCNHGYIPAGTTGEGAVFSETNSIRLSYKYLSTLFIAAYPQTIVSGTNNFVFLADTTKVIKVSKVKAFMMKSVEEKNVLSLKDAIENIKK